MVSAHSHKVSRVSWYSGYCLVSFNFGYAAFTLSRRTSQSVLLSSPLDYAVLTPRNKSLGLGSFPFARRYLGNRCFFLFLRVLRCFSSQVPFLMLCIYIRIHKVFLCRFPHSDIHGSKDICSSPWLFAAYHVLPRLSVPRHPPCALSSLTFFTMYSVTLLLVCLFLGLTFSCRTSDV